MAFTGTLDRCKVCDKTVHVVDMMTMEGIPYHKTCFRCSHCNGTLVNRTPSKLSSLFSGTQDKCAACGKTVYPHKTCFRCAHGGCTLTHSSYAALDGVLYCKHHFARLFMEKGDYKHVLNSATHKRNNSCSSNTPPPEPAELKSESEDQAQE